LLPPMFMKYKIPGLLITEKVQGFSVFLTSMMLRILLVNIFQMFKLALLDQIFPTGGQTGIIVLIARKTI